MIALIVVGAIVALILILLLLPLTLDFAYDGDFCVKVKYSGITIFDNKKSEEKAKRKAKKKKSNTKTSKAPKKDGFLKRTYKQKGLFGTISYFSDILKIVLKKTSRIIKRLKFRRFKFDLTVATDDAASTAIRYGEVCAAVYPVAALLESMIDLKSKEINVCADFEKNKCEFKSSVLVKSAVIYWLISLISILVEIYKLQRKESEENERKQSKDRNGHNDGKASRNG